MPDKLRYIVFMEGLIIWLVAAFAIMWAIGRIPERTAGRLHKGLWTVISVIALGIVVATCSQSIGRNSSSDFERTYPR